jgi:hypothetical protein
VRKIGGQFVRMGTLQISYYVPDPYGRDPAVLGGVAENDLTVLNRFVLARQGPGVQGQILIDPNEWSRQVAPEPQGLLMWPLPVPSEQDGFVITHHMLELVKWHTYYTVERSRQVTLDLRRIQHVSLNDIVNVRADSPGR